MTKVKYSVRDVGNLVYWKKQLKSDKWIPLGYKILYSSSQCQKAMEQCLQNPDKKKHDPRFLKPVMCSCKYNRKKNAHEFYFNLLKEDKSQSSHRNIKVKDPRMLRFIKVNDVEN
jgi:hypothetical protein